MRTQRGLQRAVDDVGDPQLGPQQLGRAAAARGARPCRSAWRAPARRRPHARRRRRRRSPPVARPGAEAVGQRGGQRRGAPRVDVEDGQPAGAEGQQGVRDGRAGAAGAEQHDAVERARRAGPGRRRARSPTSRCCGRSRGRRAKTTVLTAPSAAASGESSSRCGEDELLARVRDVEPVVARRAGRRPGGRRSPSRRQPQDVEVEPPVQVAEAELVGLPLVQRRASATGRSRCRRARRGSCASCGSRGPPADVPVGELALRGPHPDGVASLSGDPDPALRAAGVGRAP